LANHAPGPPLPVARSDCRSPLQLGAIGRQAHKFGAQSVQRRTNPPVLQGTGLGASRVLGACRPMRASTPPSRVHDFHMQPHDQLHNLVNSHFCVCCSIPTLHHRSMAIENQSKVDPQEQVVCVSASLPFSAALVSLVFLLSFLLSLFFSLVTLYPSFFFRCWGHLR
jgi:hypothetical protein